MKLVNTDFCDISEILSLEVYDFQKDFVATNRESLDEAEKCRKKGEKVKTFGIFDEKILVGFTMIGYECGGEDTEKKENSYYIIRFMIDKKYQNRGYGSRAMKKIIDFIKTFPMGKGEKIYLSYEEENIKAKNLYAGLGFKENGEKDCCETVAVLDLLQV